MRENGRHLTRERLHAAVSDDSLSRSESLGLNVK